MIDDMTALRECWDEADPPSPGTQASARNALLSHISQPQAPAAVVISGPRKRRWSSWAWRSGIATVAAAAVAGGLVLVGGIGGGNVAGKGQPTSPSEAIELAAVYAAEQPFTPPRPNQWSYVELQVTSAGQIAQTKGMPAQSTVTRWSRADGNQTAMLENGQVVLAQENPSVHQFPPIDYPTLAALPTDPAQLLDVLRHGLDDVADTGEQSDQMAFNAISTILRDNLLPPAVTAALLRALTLIPGVTEQSQPVQVNGHSAIAVGRVQEGYLRSDILLDAGTHEFLGSRDVAIADHDMTVEPVRVSPSPSTPDGPSVALSPGQGEVGGTTTVHVPSGEVESMMIRTAIGVVDAPGQTA